MDKADNTDVVGFYVNVLLDTLEDGPKAGPARGHQTKPVLDVLE